MWAFYTEHGLNLGRDVALEEVRFVIDEPLCVNHARPFGVNWVVPYLFRIASSHMRHIRSSGIIAAYR